MTFQQRVSDEVVLTAADSTIFWVSPSPSIHKREILLNADQISGFTALPGINNKMSQGLLDGIYWVPQIVCLFSEKLLPVLD